MSLPPCLPPCCLPCLPPCLPPSLPASLPPSLSGSLVPFFTWSSNECSPSINTSLFCVFSLQQGIPLVLGLEWGAVQSFSGELEAEVYISNQQPLYIQIVYIETMVFLCKLQLLLPQPTLKCLYEAKVLDNNVTQLSVADPGGVSNVSGNQSSSIELK